MGQLRDIKLLKKIAIVFKELREAENLTQADVFEDTKIHIGRIETAKANLSVSTLSTLCQYFEISLLDFFSKVEKVKWS